MLALETKQSRDKVFPHSDLQGGGVFLGEISRSIQRDVTRIRKVNDRFPYNTCTTKEITNFVYNYYC